MDDNMENVIIFGPVGSGKTTILNLLANTQYQTAGSGFSCTREIQKAKCSYHPFRIIDFPGTDAAVEQVQHARLQQTTLKKHHFKVVVLVCVLTARFDDLTTKLTKVIQLFRHHVNNVVAILTHCDNIDPKIQAGAQFILEQRLNLSHSFCKTSKTDGKDLANWINSFVRDPKMKRVGLGEGIFETNSFNALIVDTGIDNKVIELRAKSVKSFKQIYDATLKHFNDHKEDKDLVRALYFSLKQHMDEIADTYAEQVAPFLKDKWQLNAEIIIFQNSLMEDFSTFKSMVVREIQVENTVYNSSCPQYRECPKCGIVWFRVYGCDSIICGRRSISRDFSNHKFYNFSIRWVVDKLICEKIETTPTQIQFTSDELVGLSDKEKTENLNRAKTGKQLIQAVGCGASLKWSDMKDVTTTAIGELKNFDFDLTSETDNIFEKHKQEVTGISGDSIVEVATSKQQPKQKNIARFKDYTVDQVVEWLKSTGFGNQADKFSEQGIDGEALLELDEQSLRNDFGLNIGAAKRLLRSLCL